MRRRRAHDPWCRACRERQSSSYRDLFGRFRRAQGKGGELFYFCRKRPFGRKPFHRAGPVEAVQPIALLKHEARVGGGSNRTSVTENEHVAPSALGRVND